MHDKLSNGSFINGGEKNKLCIEACLQWGAIACSGWPLSGGVSAWQRSIPWLSKKSSKAMVNFL